MGKTHLRPDTTQRLRIDNHLGTYLEGCKKWVQNAVQRVHICRFFHAIIVNIYACYSNTGRNRLLIIQNWRIHTANMVMVFDSLQNGEISLDRLRKPVGNTKPEIVDARDILVIQYHEDQIQAAFVLEQSRLDIRIVMPQSQSDAAVLRSIKALVAVALNSRKAVKKTDLVAYGFNYFSQGVVAEHQEARQLFLDLFREPVSRLEKLLGGEIAAISPQINYLKDGRGYQLNFRPNVLGKKEMAINFNAQFDEGELPDAKSLVKAMITGRDEFHDTLNRVFER